MRNFRLAFEPNTDSKLHANRIILCELNHFFAKHIGNAYFIHELRKREPSKVMLYLPNPRWTLTGTVLEKVYHLYTMLGVDNVIISPQSSDADKFEASTFLNHHRELFIENNRNKSLRWLKWNGMPVGYHLLETVPHILGRYTIDNDEFFNVSVYVLAQISFWNRFFRGNSVSCVLHSHVCYEFLNPVLVATDHGIPCYSVNESHVRTVTLPLTDQLKVTGSESLRLAFERQLPHRKQFLLKVANDQLNRRLFDNDISNSMRLDPRQKSSSTGESMYVHRLSLDSFDPNDRKLVLYAHAFSDAPFGSKSLVDEVATPAIATEAVLRAAVNLGINTFVKTHPGNFAQDEAHLREILQSIPNVHQLPSDMTLTEVAKLGNVLIVTGYGTVAVEAAFLGLPCVAYTDESVTHSFGLTSKAPMWNDFLDQISKTSTWSLSLADKKTSAINAFAAWDLSHFFDWMLYDPVKLRDQYDGLDNMEYRIEFFDYWDRNFDYFKHLLVSRTVENFIESGQSWLSLRNSL